MVIQLNTIRNPWSLYNFGPITYTIINNQTGSTVTSQNCTGLYHSVSTLNSLASVSFSLSTTISTFEVNKTLRVFIRNPLQASAHQFQVTFSSGPTYTFNGTATTVSKTASSITLSSVITNDLTATGSNFIVYGFNVFTPPSTRPYTITFTTFSSSILISSFVLDLVIF